MNRRTDATASGDASHRLALLTLVLALLVVLACIVPRASTARIPAPVPVPN